MAGDPQLRSKRKQEVTNKKAISSPAPTTAPKVNAKVKAVASRSSLTTTTCRLSSSNRTSTVPTPAVNLEELIKSLESLLRVVETSFDQLVAENFELRQIVAHLQTELNQLKEQQETHRLPTLPTISVDQQEINSNIIIRRVETKGNTSAAELTNIYEGIRAHLGITDIAELAPVSVSLIAPNAAKPDSSLRPIKVSLPSVAVKVKFLQVTKEDIVQSNIGIASNSKCPVLITEQLTRTNQENKVTLNLSGLRTAKYSAGSNQIHESSKSSTRHKAHINHLREQLGLQPLSNYGQLHTRTNEQSATDNPRICGSILTPNFDDLNFMHWNINHLTNKQQIVEQYVATLPGILHVIAISETWLNSENKSTYKLHNYHETHSVRPNSQGGGISIFFHASICRTATNVLVDVVTPDLNHFLSLELPSIQTTIAVPYRRPVHAASDIDRFSDEMERYCLNRPHTMIMGDFNLKHLNVGYRDKLNGLLEAHGFALTNEISRRGITRLCSGTILNLCATNMTQFDHKLSLVHHSASDHSILFASVTSKLPKITSSVEMNSI